jgi:predicted CxxxxCH...CXXCH cytochrome family protein
VNKTGLTGAHVKHLNSAVVVGGVLMGAANNAGCVNCHPDNTADRYSQGRSDDGSTKAYPHASDGTNVVGDNATINAGISATKAGLNTTCAASCHPRSATITWGGSGDCDMCHYYSATPSSATNTGTGALTGGHNSHFNQSLTCDNCHTVPSDTAHASALPVVSANATVLAVLGFNTGTLTCSSTGSSCHGVGNTTPAWGTTGQGCATCHYYPGVAGRDWDMTAKVNGHTMRSDVTTAGTAKYLTHMKATGFNTLSDTYAGVTADVNSCGRCHAASTHRSGAVEVSDTHTLGLCSGTSFTFTATTPGSDVSCSNVSCHNGRTTPNWW